MTLAKDKEKALPNPKDKEPQNPVARAFENMIARPFREARAEMKKVVWPTREETTRLTVVVIILSSVISAVLFVADSLFAWLLLVLQNAVSGI